MEPNYQSIKISTGSLINRGLYDGVRTSLATRTGCLKKDSYVNLRPFIFLYDNNLSKFDSAELIDYTLKN